MKKNRWLMPMILAGMLSMGLQCEKDPPLNPDDGLTELEKLDKYVPITSEGANTFGCLVDGKFFIPKENNNPNTPSALSAEYVFEDSSLTIIGTNAELIQSVAIRINNMINKNHSLKGISGGACDFQGRGQYSNSSPDYFGYTNCIDTGSVIITKFDLSERIVSGKFWFNVAKHLDDTPKTYISEGRFDLKFVAN